MTPEKLIIANEFKVKIDKLNEELDMLNNKETPLFVGKKIYHNNPTRFKELREHTNRSIEALIRADLQSRISLLTEKLRAI